MRHRLYASLAALVCVSVAGLGAQRSDAAESINNSVVRDQVINFKQVPTLIKNPSFVTLKFDNADIREVLRVIAQRGGMNLVIDESVTGRFSIDVRAVPLDEFFGIVLRTNGLAARRVGTSLLIGKEDVLSKKVDLQQAASFRLNNSTAADALKLLTSVAAPPGAAGAGQGAFRLASDERTNSIFVVGTGEDINRVKNAIKAIDVAAPQVVIEVRLVEVSRSAAQRLGSEFGFGGSKFGVANNLTDPSVTANGQPTAGNPPSGGGATAITFSAMGNITSNLNARVNALVQRGEAQVLANPRVATQDSHTARIAIVNKFPVISVNITGGQGAAIATETVTFQNIGETLEITPRIDVNGFVTMAIEPTISVRGKDVIVNRNPVPEINERTLKTKMRVADGETVVIGGLIRRNNSSTTNKMPLLGDIPILNFLFKQESVSNDETEVIIMVTPHITSGEKPTD